jgi:hypothetical protein
MKMEFMEWLKDKEEFLNDEIENCRPGFTHVDVMLLGGVAGALRLYDQWLRSDGVATWRENFSGDFAQIPTATNRRGETMAIRCNSRRASMRRSTDMRNITMASGCH